MADWTEALRLHVVGVDTQHQEIFALCARLNAGSAEAKEADLSFLATYIDQHFADEEQLMNETNYPALDAHRDEHQRYREALAPILKRARSDSKAVAEVALSVTTWLGYHILEEDLALAGYLSAHHTSRITRAPDAPTAPR